MADITLAELKNMLPAEAIPALDDYIVRHPDSDEAFTIRGLKHWALDHRAQAIKDYHSAIAINPDSDARKALEIADSILSFYNKDLLNP